MKLRLITQMAVLGLFAVVIVPFFGTVRASQVMAEQVWAIAAIMALCNLIPAKKKKLK